ncbi:MAG: hypothetical protein ACP5OR_09240 [Candidatus Dormibacteria bacterium]
MSPFKNPLRRRHEAERRQHLSDVFDVSEALLKLAECRPMGICTYDRKPKPVFEFTWGLSFTSGSRRIAVHRGETANFPDPIQKTVQMYVRVNRNSRVFELLPERERLLLASWFDCSHDVLLSFTSPIGHFSLETLGPDRVNGTFVSKEDITRYGMESRADSLATHLRALQQKNGPVPESDMLRHAAIKNQEPIQHPQHRTAVGRMFDL